MSLTSKQPITSLLQKLIDGRLDESSTLVELIYSELRKLAGGVMKGERGLTLDPTALVNEAYVRLLGNVRGELKNRKHFFGIAARAMRCVLVDHARANQTWKRGGDAILISIDHSGRDERLLAEEHCDLLALDEALGLLEKLAPRQCRIIELKYFTGLKIPEIAELLDVSIPLVNRDLKSARGWLRGRLPRP